MSPAQRTLASPAPGVPPGLSTNGPMRVGGNPYGINAGDTPQQMIAKLPPAQRYRIGMSANPLEELAKLTMAPQTQVITGNGQNGYPPGSVYSVTTNPADGTSKVEQLSAGASPEFAAKTSRELSQDFSKEAEGPAFQLLQSQVQGAYKAAAQTSPDVPGDVNIMHALAKALDPNAIVRAGSIPAYRWKRIRGCRTSLTAGPINSATAPCSMRKIARR